MRFGSRHATRGLVAIAIVSVAALAHIGSSSGATSATVVGATVLSATSLDTTGCSGAGLSLGSMPVLTTVISPTPCEVSFGSSNDAAALRMFQSDGAGTALTRFRSNVSVHTGGPDYNGLAAASATTAWAVGRARKPGNPTPIAHTNDGGTTWTAQTSCNGQELHDVDHVSGNLVVAVGNAGTICRSDDAGASWTLVTSGTGSALEGLTIRPDGLGWIVGASGFVARTTDGGMSWTPLPQPDPSATLTEVVAASTTQLYVTGYINGNPRLVLVYTSSDAGATWSSYLIGNANATGWAYSAVALSPSVAIVGTSYGVFRTADSGSTWVEVDSRSQLCLTALDATTIVGYNGTGNPVRRSTDGGATWTTVPSPTPMPGQIWGCDSPTPTSTWYAGFNDQRARSIDAALTWTVAPTTYRNLVGVAAWNANTWVGVGADGAIRRTDDAGVTVTSPPSGTADSLTDVVRTTHQAAIAVGANGTVLRTEDRGITWTSVATGTSQNLRSADLSPDGAVYAVGGSAVLKSLDQGITWATTAAVPAGTLTAVAAGPDGVVWVGTSTGQLHRSTDHGSTWTAQTSGTTLSINDIDTPDGVRAIAVTTIDTSSESRVLRTSDSGAAWSTAVASGHGYSVVMPGQVEAIIGASSGYRRSTDAGATWTTYSGVTNAYGVDAVDTNTILIAGQGDVMASVRPTTSFGDYVAGSNDFSGTTSTFGACLHAASGATATHWPVAGTGNCTAALVGNWRGIATDATAPTALVAQTSSGTSADLDFRFGAKAAAAQSVGDYLAGVTWEVVAPG